MGFNLYGLRGRFNYYSHALEMILSTETPDEEDLADGQFMEIYKEAADLYGLIHVRYIVSPRGLQVMREKYLKGTFGTCPRVLCDRQHVLPIGTSEELRSAQVKIFCPKCEQVYSPKSKYKDLDGAYFGTSFPQIFLQSYPSLVPLEPPRPFVPRVFGFKLHKQKSLIARKLEEDQGPSQSQPGNTIKQVEKHSGMRECPEEGSGEDGTQLVDGGAGRVLSPVF